MHQTEEARNSRNRRFPNDRDRQPIAMTSVRRQKSSVSTSEYFAIAVSVMAAVWFMWREPITFALFGAFGIAFWSLWKISDYFPFLQRKLGINIGYGHVVAATLTMTLLLSAFETPSYAIFLDGLEKYIVETLETSNSGIEADSIALVFNAIRIIFLLLVAAAALFAFNQAQQGNDWRPIVTQIGMAVGIVLVVDVITFIFIGNAA